MIKNENRLRKNKHFKFIYKNGESKKVDKITIVYVKTKYKPFKVGFSVSKKIGKSVIRSKVKRRLRESFCSLYKNINSDYNYIFIANEGIDKMTFWQIKSNMEELLKKANVYVESV